MEVVQNFLNVSELWVDEIFLHEFAGVGVLVQLGPHVLGVLPASKAAFKCRPCLLRLPQPAKTGPRIRAAMKIVVGMLGSFVNQ